MPAQKEARRVRRNHFPDIISAMMMKRSDAERRRRKDSGSLSIEDIVMHGLFTVLSEEYIALFKSAKKSFKQSRKRVELTHSLGKIGQVAEPEVPPYPCAGC